MPEQRTAVDWVQQVLYGQGPYVGQFMGGLGMPAAQSALGGMGLVGPGMFGAGGTPQGMAGNLMLPAVLANIFSSPAMPFVGGGTANLTGRAMMGLAGAGAFPNVQGGGGVLPGGFGVGPGAMGGITGMMEGMTGQGPRDLSMMDVARITSSAGQGGFFGGATNVRQVREKLREMVRTVKSMSEELSMTIDEVSSGMNAMRSMGYNTIGSAAGAMKQVMRQSAAGGFAPSEMMAYQQQMGETMRGAAGIPLAMASSAAGNVLGFVGGAVRGGFVGSETLQNAYGASGQQGAMMMSNRIQEMGMRLMERAPMQFSMAAVMDPATGKISQERMNQLLTGQMSTGDIQRFANQYVGSLEGGLAQWKGQMPEMRGQFLQAGGGMAPMALAQKMMQQHGFGADPNDPRSRAAFSAAMRNMGIRMDPMESRGMMELMGNLGNISEANALAVARQQEQEQTAQRRVDLLAQRDPVYQLRRLTQDYSDKITREVESRSVAVAQRLERLTDRAAGGTFEVITSAASASGRDLGAFLGGAGVTAEDRQAGFFAEGARDVEGRRALQLNRRARARQPMTQERLAGLWGGGLWKEGAELGAVRATEGEQAFMTRGFMGEDRAGYLQTPEEVRQRLGLPGKETKEGKAFFDTAKAREDLVKAYSAATPEVQKEISKVFGSKGVMSAEDVVMAFASASPERAGLATRALVGSGREGVTGHGLALTARHYTEGARAVGGVRGESGAALGLLEHAYGTSVAERYRTEGMAGVGRGLTAMSQATFGGKYAREGETFAMMAPEAAEGLTRALQGGLTLKGGATLGEYFKKAGVEPEGISKDMLQAPVSSPEQLGRLISGQGAAISAQLADDALKVGWLSKGQREKYGEISGSGKLTGRALAFVESMSKAGLQMEVGQGYEGQRTAGGAMLDLLREGTRGDIRRLEKAGALHDPSEVRRLRGVFKGGVTTEEFMKEVGAGSKEEAAGMLGIEATTGYAGAPLSAKGELERMSEEERSKKYEEYLANRAVKPGGGAAGGGGGMANDFASVLAGFAEGGALRVVVQNMPGGTGGGTQLPAGGSDDPKGGGTTYFQHGP